MNPVRKPNRLRNFDYSEDGAYFITICTKDRKQILSRITAADESVPPVLHLTEVGRIVNAVFTAIPEHYPNVLVDHFVIMPNHIHLLLWIKHRGRSVSAPTDAQNPSIDRIIRHCKAFVTRKPGSTIWQTGFYDHVIRDERDYLIRAQYIENNPAKWAEDEYNINDLSLS